MSTHNMCFCGEIKQYYVDTPSYLELFFMAVGPVIQTSHLFSHSFLSFNPLQFGDP